MSVYEHTNTNNTPSFSTKILVVATAHPSASLMRLISLFFMLTLITKSYPRSAGGKCACMWVCMHACLRCVFFCVCMCVWVLKSLHKVLINLAVIPGLAMLIKSGAITCELGNADCDFGGAINKAVQVKASWGANEVSQVIFANQRPGQDLDLVSPMLSSK